MNRPVLLSVLLGITTIGLHAQYFNAVPDGTVIDGTVQYGPGNQQGQTPPINTYDADVTSSDQTFGPTSYIGLVGGSTLKSVTTGSPVVALQVNFAIFFDGGWFGPNGEDALPVELAASGNTEQAPLTALDLSVLPSIEITTDGTNWTTVNYTSNYVSQLEGIYHYNEVISPTVTFDLVDPAKAIEGIELIGESGGTSDFVGISNFVVVAPEPSTYALLGCGALALFGVARWRRLA
jgi:hypothetical protein